jgi:HlyD family secretion protein
MHVEAAVDEADIGQLRMGQPVNFTVDAYQGEIFKGDVRQIRLQPVVTSNVVTYTVIVNAPNPEKKLMPGMTANITVLVQKIDSVLIVPGKALRFTPDAAWLAEYMKKNPPPQRQENAGTGQYGANERRQGTDASGQTRTGDFQSAGQQGKKPVVVWIKTGDKVHRTRVITGAVDGTNAEVKFGLKEGDEVILSMNLPGKAPTPAAAAPPPATSPFMPQRGRR